MPKERDGQILAFDMHRGTELSVDNVKLISAPQPATAALALEADVMQGCINLVATSTVQLHLSKKPKHVYVGSKTTDFTFDDENQLVTFALSSGDHRILIK